MAIERQELQCTNCGRFVRFDMDFGLDGNHEIACPECYHIHYRVVRNGLITEERWRSSAGPTYYATNIASSASSYIITASATTTGTSFYLYDAWLATGS